MIRVKIGGLYCSEAKERNLEKLEFFVRRLCEYLPAKYSLIRECVYSGVENIDSIILKETLREKIERTLAGILGREVLPKICFDAYGNVGAIHVGLFEPFLRTNTKDRVIGVTNVYIHNGVERIGGFPLGEGIVESMVYWKRYLEICGKLSTGLLVKILARSCMHEIAESYGCFHHEGDCLMNILIEALYRPERLCEECERKMIERYG